MSLVFSSKTVEVYTMEEGLNTSDPNNQGDPTLIKQRISIKNTGTETLTNIKWYYYLTAATGTTPTYTIWWAPNCTVTLVKMSESNVWRAEFQYTGTIAPGVLLPVNSTLSVGITNTDANKVNDYSYNRSATLSINNKIPVYEGSTLLSGTEPSNTTPDVGTYDLLIVTVDKYLNAANKLAAWKEQLGFRTVIVSKTKWDNASFSIDNNSNTNYGQINASPIRKAIEPYYKNGKGISYLLIIGSELEIPPVEISSWTGDPEFSNDQQTDIFYASYGKIVDELLFKDKIGDVYFSRMYAETATDADIIVTKSINYEKTPITNPLYYNQFGAILTTTDDASNYTYNLEEQINHLKSESYNELYFSKPELATGTFNYTYNVMDVFNRANFLNFYRGHGYDYTLRDYLFRTSDIKQVNNTANAIDLLITCWTGQMESNGLAVNLLRAPDKGAVGIVAASQMRTNTYYNNDLMSNIINTIWPSSSTDVPEYCMSKVLSIAKVKSLNNPAKAVASWETQAYNFYGDPTLEIRTQAPFTITASYPKQIDYRELSFLTTNIKGNGTILGSGKVTLSYNSKVVSTNSIYSNGSSMLKLVGNLTPGTKLTLTVYSHNGIPMIDEIEVINKDNISSNLPILSLQQTNNTISIKRDKLLNTTLRFTILVEGSTSSQKYSYTFASGSNTYNYGTLNPGQTITIIQDKIFNPTEGNYLIGYPATISNYTNLLPVAQAMSQSVTMNQQLAMDLKATDQDGTIASVEITQPSHGTAVLVPNSLVVNYTPTANYIGADAMQYRVKDNSGSWSAWATITITVNDIDTYQKLSLSFNSYFSKINADYKDYLLFAFDNTYLGGGTFSNGKSSSYTNSTMYPNFIKRNIVTSSPRVGSGWNNKVKNGNTCPYVQTGNIDVLGRLNHNYPVSNSGVINYFQSATSGEEWLTRPIYNSTNSNIDINRTNYADLMLPAKFDMNNILFADQSLITDDFFTNYGITTSPVSNGTTTLDPGVYNTINLYQNATITLKSGVYFIQNISTRDKYTTKILLEQEGDKPIIIYYPNSYIDIEIALTKGDASKIFWYTPTMTSIQKNFVGRLVSFGEVYINDGLTFTGQIISQKIWTPPGQYIQATGTQTIETLLGNKEQLLDRTQTNAFVTSGYTFNVTPPAKQSDTLTINYEVPALAAGSNMVEFVVYTSSGNFIKGLYNEIFSLKCTMYGKKLGEDLLPGNTYYMAMFHNGVLVGRKSFTVEYSDIRFVRSNASLGGNGRSWTTAYKYLQDALYDANNSTGDITEIRVAAGTYYPDQDEKLQVTKNDLTASFNICNGLTIKGGYPANGGLESERHPLLTDAARNVTILSGDLNHDGTLRSYNVASFIATNGIAAIDGIDITMGQANGTITKNLYGGAIYCYAKQLYINNSIISNNNANIEGGAIYSESTILTINDSRFLNNTVNGYGGAISYNTDNLTINNCLFDGNKSYAQGGSIYMVYRGTTANVISNSTFSNGYCSAGGGAIYANNGIELELNNCNFIKNQANSGIGGGAIYYGSTEALSMNGCVFSENFVPSGAGYGSCLSLISAITVNIDNCLFNKNSAQVGGVISIITSSTSTLNISNSTFYGNKATWIGACVYGSSYNLNIVNSILWNNTSSNNTIFEGSTTPAITYSCIEGGWAGDGNISTNPFFTNEADADGADNIFRTADDGLQLNDYSACVDAGTDYPSTDLIGHRRPYGNNNDMGAYELFYQQKRPIFSVVADAVNKRFIITSNRNVDALVATATFTIMKYDGSTYNQTLTFPIDPLDTIYVSDVDFGDQITLVDDPSYKVSDVARTAILPMQYNIRYVDMNAAAGGDGKTWATAYQYLQDAVNDVTMSRGEVYEIQIAQGTYKPDDGKNIIKGNRDATMSLSYISSRDVSILGGFPTGGAPKQNRNPELYKVYVDGNINNASLVTDNSKQLFYIGGTSSAVTFEGITFKNNAGEGFFAVTARNVGAINFIKCSFNSNISALHIDHSSSNISIRDCNFEYNKADASISALGVYEIQGTVEVVNCKFKNNLSTSGSQVFSASMFFKTLDVTNCEFTNNTGNACYIYALTAEAIKISHCSFIGNTGATYGSAINAYIVNNPYIDALITNCLFSGNASTQYGGAIFSTVAYLKIYSSTFVGNSAPLAGGAYYTQDYGHTPAKSTEIRNSIFWNNISNATNGKDQIAWEYTMPIVNTSCIKDAVAGDINVFLCPGNENNLNTDTDPLFVSNGSWNSSKTIWTNGDYRLTTGSKCIDGTFKSTNEETTDLAGNNRITDRYMDLGAYEGTFTKTQVDGLAIYQAEMALPNQGMSQVNFYIINNGSASVSDFIVYYYFRTENGSIPQYSDYYTPNSTETIEDLGNGNYRVAFNFTGSTSSPGSRFPASTEYSFGLHYQNYTTWDKTNDYSNNLSTSFVKNTAIVMYCNGSLVYGTEPTLSTMKNAAETTLVKEVRDEDRYNMTLSPNPLQNTGRIAINAPEKSNGIVKVYSMTGQEIISIPVSCSQGENLYSLNANSIPASGVFILQLTINSRVVAKQLFVKIK